MSRLPQPTRLLHPTSQHHSSASSPLPGTGIRTDTGTRTSLLSPKLGSSVPLKISPKPVVRYQLQDPGAIVSAGPTESIMRRVIRRPGGAIVEREVDGTCLESRMSIRESVIFDAPVTTPSPCRSRIPVPHTRSRPRQGLAKSPLVPNASTSYSSRIPLPRPQSGISSINTTPRPISYSGNDQYSPVSHSTPIQRPGPNSSTWRTSIQYQPSPVISICATVATATATAFAIPPTIDPEWRCDRQSASECDYEVERQSNYSSASRLVRERSRTPVESDHYETLVHQDDYHHDLARSDSEGGFELSRISSTTSYSSASSLARHRLSQRQAIPMSTTTSTSTQEVRLIWQPDLESLVEQSDPAENLWREIEARLNRRSIPLRERDERGQWVLTGTGTGKRSRPLATGVRGMGLQYPSEEEAGQYGMRSDDGLQSKGMKKEDSEFTISAYFDPDLSTPMPPQCRGGSRGKEVDWEGTALFNMSAPLISSSCSEQGSHSSSISRSSEEGGMGVGPTPANTPYIDYSTIQRVSRVRKSSSMSSSRSSRFCSSTTSGSRSRSDSNSAVVTLAPLVSTQPINRMDDQSFDTPSEVTSIQDREQSIPTPHSHTRVIGSRGMYRLDSHVVAVLEELSDTDLYGGEGLFQVTDDNQSEDEVFVNQKSSSYIDQSEINESTPIPLAAPYHRTNTEPSNPDKTSYRYRHDQIQSVGLGMGMNLHLDSVYGLPILPQTLSSNLLPSHSNSMSISNTNSACSDSTSTSSEFRSDSSNTTISTSTSTSIADLGPVSTRSCPTGYVSIGGDNRAAVDLEKRGWARRSETRRDWNFDTVGTGRDHEEVEQDVEKIELEEEEEEEEEEEMLTVTDLDTGHRVDLSIKRLDELWIL